MTTGDKFLIEDTFKVLTIDADGKRFDHVSRITAESESLNMLLSLDVNVTLFPLLVGTKMILLLTPSITLPGSINDNSESTDASWRPHSGPTLADKYEYVMHGRVFKFEDVPNGKMALFVSFGGLLMRLEGDPKLFSEVAMGSDLYLLVRKV